MNRYYAGKTKTEKDGRADSLKVGILQSNVEF